MPPTDPDRSYRALLAVPSIGRVLLGMQVARIAQSMVNVAAVLFTLSTYGSAPLAGLVGVALTLPGILCSPIAGALLDRHGRMRLVTLDYLVAAASLGLIAGLAIAGALPAWLLVLIAGVSSLTSPLSTAGLRSLFPILVPRPLWERANAADSVGYVLATVVGPPLAGLLVVVAGPAQAIAVIGIVFVAAAVSMIGIPEPGLASDARGGLLVAAWAGLVYTWRNRTLRGLGISFSVLNIVWGINAIVIPLLVLDRLGGGPVLIGLLFAAQGIGGIISSALFGRVDTRGREHRMLVYPMLGSAAILCLLLPDAGLAPVLIGLILFGILNGPTDIAMFTLRQRRTDPAWMGRAFAVSMSFNFLGFPIGTGLAGVVVVAHSLDAAIAIEIGACLVAAVAAQLLIPFDRVSTRPAVEP
ncbi:MAG TPA: MFS transporter [Candidatus Limnocylindrales bacterium]